jgi:hypothetical protein
MVTLVCYVSVILDNCAHTLLLRQAGLPRAASATAASSAFEFGAGRRMSKQLGNGIGGAYRAIETKMPFLGR